MENSNIPPFVIGQKVVAIQNWGNIVKDKIYTITDQFRCKCGIWVVSYGIKHGFTGNIYNSCTCGRDGLKVSSEWWHDSVIFRPIQENKMKIISYSKILEEVPVCEN